MESTKKQALRFLYQIKQILKQQRYSGKRINATIRANDSNTQIHKTLQELLKEALHTETTSISLTKNIPKSIYQRDLDSMRQKINKDIQDLNTDPEQVNLTNVYRALHFKYTKY